MNLSPKLAELLAKARAQKTQKAGMQLPQAPTPSVTDKHGNVITYNEAQNRFIELAAAGKSCVLLGAAGTGKTTCQKGVITALMAAGKIPALPDSMVHKSLLPGSPGILIVSFTRRSVSNIKRNVSADIQKNCLTVHKALEYQPTYYEILDEETGEYRKTMRFEPTRGPLNPLPPEIHTVIVEESSMVSVELFLQLKEACPHNPQFIFLGDIQQLPPTFGSAILGYAMIELPTVELTEVYRQALDSPIIRLAHRLLSGVSIPAAEQDSWHVPGKLKIHPWKKKLKEDVACLTAAAFLKQAIDHGSYDVDTDMVLCPFNKAFGTLELNKHIANHLARKAGRTTYEIIAGFNKHYFSVGDRVLCDKEDGKILSIVKNSLYLGKRPQAGSPSLDYWGHDSGSGPAIETDNEYASDNETIDAMLTFMSDDASEDKVNKASHIIKVWLEDSEREVELTTAAEINSLLLGYALTVHKSQGSEWDKVFLLLHQSHSTMIQRELLYTAVTRAKQELYIICEPETFVKGILSQRIQGNTLEEKAEFFKGKQVEGLKKIFSN